MVFCRSDHSNLRFLQIKYNMRQEQFFGRKHLSESINILKSGHITRMDSICFTSHRIYNVVEGERGEQEAREERDDAERRVELRGEDKERVEERVEEEERLEVEEEGLEEDREVGGGRRGVGERGEVEVVELPPEEDLAAEFSREERGWGNLGNTSSYGLI